MTAMTERYRGGFGVLGLDWDVPFGLRDCTEISDIFPYPHVGAEVIEAERFTPLIRRSAALAVLGAVDDEIFVRRDVLGGGVDRMRYRVEHQNDLTSPVEGSQMTSPRKALRERVIASIGMPPCSWGSNHALKRLERGRLSRKLW